MTCSGAADEAEREDEETSTAAYASSSEGGEAEREAAVDSAWANMSRAEALEVLELAPDATPDAIREAHRRISRRIRPEQGRVALLGRSGRPRDGRAPRVARIARPAPTVMAWPGRMWSALPCNVCRRVVLEPRRRVAPCGIGPRRRASAGVRTMRRIRADSTLRDCPSAVLGRVRTLPERLHVRNNRPAPYTTRVEPAGVQRDARSSNPWSPTNEEESCSSRI